MRLLPLFAVLVLAACGGQDGSSEQPSEERTYLCGSYESLDQGTRVTAPPC